MEHPPDDGAEPDPERERAEFEKALANLQKAGREWLEHYDASTDGMAMLLSEVTGKPFTRFTRPIFDLVHNCYMGEITDTEEFPLGEIMAAVYTYSHDRTIELCRLHTFPVYVNPRLDCENCSGKPPNPSPTCPVDCRNFHIRESNDLGVLRRELEFFLDMERHPAREAVWEMTLRLAGFHLLTGKDKLFRHEYDPPHRDRVIDQNSHFLSIVEDTYGLLLWTLGTIQEIMQDDPDGTDG
jgi:hypothetical protein